MNNKEKLTLYRQNIDGLDEKIKKLLVERMEIVKSVAEYKRENNIEIFQAGREEDVLKKITAGCDESLSDALTLIYKAIMNASKEYQQKHISAEIINSEDL